MCARATEAVPLKAKATARNCDRLPVKETHRESLSFISPRHIFPLPSQKSLGKEKKMPELTILQCNFCDHWTLPSLFVVDETEE
ncbi:hypothetical protein CEXT_438151 [Caerostris extrusa]|uniref:Uncharacterized protein n=1 Tax=Caerostris extrusa TaxID=172846 RepID=A0AAV4MD60_CAEEX|nr:hypothetical protein CEXT_438151 [Caerostris extrusa]